MKILVTGGCGFVGSHLTERLVSEGFKVRVLGLSCELENIRRMVEQKKIEFIRGDLTDKATCRKAVEGCDLVSHLAGLISVDQSIEEPERFFMTNVGGTFRILEAAREAKVKRFHHMSTCEVLGLIEEPHKADESWPHPSPRSPYAASKFAAESYCRSYYTTYGMPITITRCFNIYGPRQSPSSRGAFIPKVITKVLNRHSPLIFGDGEQSRDWTYVEDIADGIYRALVKDGIEGELFHLASGVARKVKDITDEVIELCGLAGVVSPTRVAARPGELRRSVGDASKAKRILNWAPQVDFTAGLKRTIEFFRANGARKPVPGQKRRTAK